MTVERAPRLWIALLAVVVITAAAGLGAHYLYRDRTETTVTSIVAEGAASGSKTPSATGGQPGSGTVAGTQDAVAHPQFAAIKDMTQDYFDGINQRNYEKFAGAITRARADQEPKSKFDHDFKSTMDRDILIYRIEAAPQGRLRVLLGFTSVQDPADAPPELQVPCINWHVVWPLVKDGNRWLIDNGPEAKEPQHDACPSA